MAVPAAIIGALLVGGCHHTIKATTDYDHAVVLQDYHTFFLLAGEGSGDAVHDYRLTTDITSALLSKGWAETPPDEARAVVVVNTATAAKPSQESFYEGWSGWQWRIPGTNPAAEQRYQAGTVVVDIFDAETKRAIWHGWSGDLRTPPTSPRAEHVLPAVAEIFKLFPPAE